jgi:hypothetical protein
MGNQLETSPTGVAPADTIHMLVIWPDPSSSDPQQTFFVAKDNILFL